MQNDNVRRSDADFLKDAWATLRQWTYPEEFRIPKPAWDQEWVATLEDLASSIQAQAELLAENANAPANEEADYSKLLVDVSTGLWRTRNRLTGDDPNTPKDGMERVFRHVQSIFDALENHGIRILDHTGERWVDGRSISALAFQPTPGLTQSVIIETVRPSVFIGEKHMQMAQVVVGVPPEEKSEAESATTEIPEKIMK